MVDAPASLPAVASCSSRPVPEGSATDAVNYTTNIEHDHQVLRTGLDDCSPLATGV
jgi:hypothetical protein